MGLTSAFGNIILPCFSSTEDIAESSSLVRPSMALEPTLPSSPACIAKAARSATDMLLRVSVTAFSASPPNLINPASDLAIRLMAWYALPAFSAAFAASLNAPAVFFRAIPPGIAKNKGSRFFITSAGDRVCALMPMIFLMISGTTTGFSYHFENAASTCISAVWGYILTCFKIAIRRLNSCSEIGAAGGTSSGLSG